MSQFDMFAPVPSPAPRMPEQRIQSSALLHEIFFALRPSAEDALRLSGQAAREDARLGVGGKALAPGRLHVSLHGMASYVRGEPFPQADVERWLQAASTLAATSFEVTFDRLATFGGDTNPLVFKAGAGAGVAEVRAFRRELGIALANSGEAVRDRTAEPHMSVSYGGMRVAEVATAPIRWAPAELVLIDSHFGKGIHEVLASWPLRA